MLLKQEKLSDRNFRGYQHLLMQKDRPIWKPMHMQPIYRLNPFIDKRWKWTCKNKCIYFW